MTYTQTLRSMEAAARRQQREAKTRLRELERRAKEQAKLSAMEQARLEVETYDNRVELLLSVHKDRGKAWDWVGISASLPPPSPIRTSHHEFTAKRQLLVSPPTNGENETLQQARNLDDHAFQEAVQSYESEQSDSAKLKDLARRILEGDSKAYTEALVELSPLGEISELGSTLHFTVHDRFLLECVLVVNGIHAIPSEVKSLTASGKLAVKAMPKARFHELYQDYISSCMLRVAREAFALLPINMLLITASASSNDPGTGRSLEQPVMSAAMPRASLEKLNFDYIDPSEAVESFLHRGDFKATRKSGAFAPITPITPADLPKPQTEQTDLDTLVIELRRLRNELNTELAVLAPDRASPSA